MRAAAAEPAVAPPLPPASASPAAAAAAPRMNPLAIIQQPRSHSDQQLNRKGYRAEPGGKGFAAPRKTSAVPGKHLTMSGRAQGREGDKPVKSESVLGCALSKATHTGMNSVSKGKAPGTPANSQIRRVEPFGQLHIASLRRTHTRSVDELNKQSLNEFAENMEWEI